ncbi:thioredoxin domain-containing protein [Candidatus Uhrbacteria bacterium]|jgi:protein-disulfide isomerase|nr:thioredoxin domain-containing protein [Candidatus Uhrbacteria bacterium]
MDNKPQGFFDGNPKMIFVFGLVSGIALAFILGGGVPSISLGGGDNSDVVRTFDVEDDDDDSGSAPAAAAELAPVTGDEWIRGDIENAAVVLVEYSDFECPFCSRHHPTMEQVMEEYGDDVAWVYRHFPLSFHSEAEPSALAAECVGNLAGNDAFWEFADAAFDNHDSLDDDFYLEQALELGVSEADFTECYENDTYAADIAEDQASASKAGVSGTPATYVNGVLVSGAVPFESFASLIDEILEN